MTIQAAAATQQRHGMAVPAVRITVADSGYGIPSEDLARLFEPFFTTRSEEGGTGLGLAVVRSLVQEHNGEVWAESEMGSGSRFHVLLAVEGPTPLQQGEIAA